MPIYEYRCIKCDSVFSELRKMAEREDPITCPQCGGEARVIVSGFAHSSGTSPACPVANSCDTKYT